MKCVLCGRRASRACPVLGSICPLCCGRGRGRTVDCASDCGHYVRSRLRAVERLLELGGDPTREYRSADVLHNLRLAIVQVVRARLRDSRNAEAAEALGNLADSLKTRASGLIYDFRSSNPRVQMVTDALSVPAGMHERGEKGLRRASADEVEQCARHLKRQAEGAERRQSGFADLCRAAVGRDYVTDREGETGAVVPSSK